MKSHDIEILEPRLAPAGTVLLSTAGGVLTLTGDIAANDIGLTQSAPGTWQITDPVSPGSTLFSLNGGVASVSLTFDAVQSIKASLNGGSDSLSLDGIQVNGVLSITGNDGDDAITVANGINNGALTVDSGNGADTIALAGSFNSTVTVKAGAGVDQVQIGGGFYGRGITADLGADSNDFLIQAGGAVSLFGPLSVSAAGGTAATQNFTLASPDLFIAGNASFKTTAGATAFTAGLLAGDELHVSGSLTVQTAAGNDTFNLSRTLAVNGGLTISAGNGANDLDTTGLAGLTAGSFAFTGGTGMDTISLRGATVSISGQASINAGAGDNSLDLNQSSSLRIGGSLLYTGGAHKDDIDLNGPSIRIGGQLGITVGNGANTFASVSLGALTTAGLAFSGGAGTDAFTLQGTAVAIGANTTFTLGAGNNAVILDPAVSLRIGGSVIYTGDLGNDSLAVQGPVITVGGAFSFKGGNGTNDAAFRPVTGSVGSLSLTGGTGQDIFDIGDFFGTTSLVTVHGNIVSNMGAGDGEMGIRDALVYGSVSHTSASVIGTDSFRIRESEVLGAVTANLGGMAVGIVEISDSMLRAAVTIATGGGNDVVNFDSSGSFLGSKNTFKAPVKVTLGAGNDTFNAGVNPAVINRANDFLAALTIDGGADTDTANFQTGYGNSFATPPTTIAVETVN